MRELVGGTLAFDHATELRSHLRHHLNGGAVPRQRLIGEELQHRDDFVADQDRQRQTSFQD